MGIDENEQGCVCEFSGVRLAGGGKDPLDFRIAPGELYLIRVPRGVDRPDIAGAAVGMAGVEEGSVRVLGFDWSAGTGAEAEAVRQRIGRVFDIRYGPVWLQNLDIEENLLLPHTIAGAEPVAETRARMESIGREFGFEEIPKSRPAGTRLEVTQAAQCVRALMRKELRLLVLEVPTRRAAEGMEQRLRGMVERVLERGCGVLWITDDSETEEDLPTDLASGDLFYGKSRWTDNRVVDED